MKVSIITSCYNREATIRGAIESVLEQDYPYIEYIVVDGASKDNSLAVINEYKNGIDTIISEPDKGMYEAINKGIRAATGDIIGLIHSDDFLFSSHTISDIVKTFEEQDADMIYGNGVFVDYDDTNQMIRNWISGRYSKENVKNGWLPLHPTVYMFRVDEIIAYVSRFMTLKIGDLLFTGTPVGVGPVSIGQHLQGYLGEEKVLDFNIR